MNNICLNLNVLCISVKYDKDQGYPSQKPDKIFPKKHKKAFYLLKNDLKGSQSSF